MRDKLDLRGLAHASTPLALAALLLATAPLWQRWTVESSSGPLWQLLALAAVAVGAALYVPASHRTLGLGTIALAPAVWLFGVAWAGWVAAGAYLLRELLRHFFFGVPLRRSQGLGILPTFAAGGRVTVATILAGWLGISTALGGTAEGRAFWTRIGFAVIGYLVVMLASQAVESRWLLQSKRWLVDGAGRALALDASGWLIGAVAIQAVASDGWVESLVLLAVVALLAVEAARNVHLRRRAVARVSELWEVTRAGHRIIFRDPDLAGMAGTVLEECRNVLPVHWFQFELLEGESVAKSWCAGPDGEIREGIPEPADSPPALPGVHRRSSWKILGRELQGDGRPIARLRLWCDPRRLESTSVELLDSLLPQVAASVHRALLDRRAKQDPLTGLADRRVLESRLEQVFHATQDEGGSMAVVMCDLDRFKKINDTHGHDVGDQALLQVVKILEEHRRDTDLCSRYGGEEFALVLEKTDGATALRVAERLRLEVERSIFVADGSRIVLRLSAGVAAYPKLHVSNGKELLLLADEALMEAKKRGRNRSLLHLGRARFQTIGGKTLESEDPPPEPKMPTLFA